MPVEEHPQGRSSTWNQKRLSVEEHPGQIEQLKLKGSRTEGGAVGHSIPGRFLTNHRARMERAVGWAVILTHGGDDQSDAAESEDVGRSHSLPLLSPPPQISVGHVSSRLSLFRVDHNLRREGDDSVGHKREPGVHTGRTANLVTSLALTACAQQILQRICRDAATPPRGGWSR